MLPYWYDAIAPELLAGRTVLVAAHGNSLRALIKHLDGISDADITALEIPTGVPIVYELDDRLAMSAGERDLGDPEAIAGGAPRRSGARATGPPARPGRVCAMNRRVIRAIYITNRCWAPAWPPLTPLLGCTP